MPIESLRRAIQLNPEFYTAHFNLGEILVERAELALDRKEDPSAFVGEAARLLDLSIAAWPDWPAPYFLQVRGQTILARWRLDRNEDPSAALAEGRERVETALNLAPDPRGMLLASELHLVEAEWKLTRNRPEDESLARARNLLRRAEEVNADLPESSEVARELERIEALTRR